MKYFMYKISIMNFIYIPALHFSTIFTYKKNNKKQKLFYPFIKLSMLNNSHIKNEVV